MGVAALVLRAQAAIDTLSAKPWGMLGPLDGKVLLKHVTGLRPLFYDRATVDGVHKTHDIEKPATEQGFR